MKKLEVKNIAGIEAVPFNGSTEFKLKPIVAPGESKQCSVNVVEIEPNGQAFSYHYHEMNEELFFILSGRGMVRTADGELEVGSGDAITFPAGPEGAHVIRNVSSTEKLVYIDYGTCNPAEIVHFPDMNKILAIGPFSSGMYDIQ
ncbi:cupin domain-containing protein [Victivallis vadensis]|jgi:hypothetical protein|uniref:cupin domain-containing protein n=1 Tax=Victivallis vadensis TaxID=172901 RepID=UPI00266C73BD|nr:cupin domain-containing protein [Victivallis vadensis]